MIYSILITSWECYGAGCDFMKRNLEAICNIEYRPLQVVVSDHSKNDDIKNLVDSIDSKGVEVVYVRYNENHGNPAHNWNNALKFATGNIIQYFTMDDWFHDPTAVTRLVQFFNENSNMTWCMVPKNDSPANTTFVPYWNQPSPFRNTIGGPNSIIFRSSVKHIQMDPILVWFVDCEWYFRLHLKLGDPVLYPGPAVYTCRTHPLQLQHEVQNDVKIREQQIILNKYKDMVC